MYQNLKLVIIDLTDLSKDAIHIHVGMIVFLLVVLLWKKGRFELVCVLPVLIIAFLMEALDLRDDMNSMGYMRWSASAHDIVNTTLWPVVLTLLAKLKVISLNI